MISVIIRDKPLVRPEKEVSLETVQAVFQGLLINAQLERKVRDFRRCLREKRALRRSRLYFGAWREETLRSRELRLKELAMKREKLTNETKIELFVNALAERKKRLLQPIQNQNQEKFKKSQEKKPMKILKKNIAKKEVVYETPAQSRLKAQKEIIEEQRRRLAEQSKYIDKLKRQEMEKQVRKNSQETVKVTKEAIDVCIRQNRRNLAIRKPSSEAVVSRDTSVSSITPPKMALRIEERIEQRRRRMKEIEEERQKKRDEQKRSEEERKRLLEEQQRQQQLIEYQEVTKQRKNQEVRRRREIDRITRLQNLSNTCFNRYLFRNYFLRPLSRLVLETKAKVEIARCHYQLCLLRRVTRSWIIFWQDQRSYKMQVAVRFHRQSLLWSAFTDWKKSYFEIKQSYQMAVNFYDGKLLRKYWLDWRGKFMEVKNRLLKKEHQAVGHHEARLKLTCFFAWKKFILLADEIREKDKRREAWRALIKKYVPRNDSRKAIHSNA